MKFKITLFKKYLGVSLLVVMLSFLILGLMLWVFILKYWEEEKRSLLSKNAHNITDLIEKNSTFIDNTLYILNGEIMKSVLATFSRNIESDIFIVNSEGEVILCPEVSSQKFLKARIPHDILEETKKDIYFGASNFGGIYENKHYGVGVSIVIKTDEKEVIRTGAVFIVSDASYILKFRNDILNLFLMAVVFSLIISSIAVGAVSYRMTRPLKKMANIVRRFGKQDFSDRVRVNTNDEIGDLALAFNNMAESLSISENARRSFIANVSHELKTPMTSISGFIDGILDGTVKAEDQRHYLKIVSGEIKRLSRLVKSMLELSKIENKEIKLNKQIFNLMQVIFSVLLNFEKKIEEKNIKITGLEEIKISFIEGDLDAIYQVIYNLIENAVKFTDINGEINFKMNINLNRTEIIIKNTGQGIKSSEINFIFDRFYKTDKSRSQDKNGMGLGLYIVKTIIQLHGGEIKARSVEGEYCEFIFWLPINRSKYNNLKTSHPSGDY